MRLPNGAFKSAIDAETDGVEGAFYVWTAEEVEVALVESEMSLFAPIFGLDRDPNIEGDRHTLFLTDSYSAHAERLGLAETELLARLDPLLVRLASIRKQRPFPIVDDKVLCDWNGMTIGAFARAGHVFGIDQYKEAAIRAASFLLTLQDDRGVQLHVWRDGHGKIPAFLDDYAFLIRGLLILHEVTETQRWLDEAVRLTTEMEERLAAPGGGYFQSGPDPELLVRPVSVFDGAIPSGNGIAILNLIHLGSLTGNPIYGVRAERALKAFSADLQRAPGAVTTIALAAQTWSVSGRTSGNPDAIDELARSVVLATLEPGGSVQQEGWREFIVKLEIREGWHVNANPASLDFLIPTQITGRVRKIRYPSGEPLRFAFADEQLRVYSSEAVIRGELDEEKASLDLTYQACDERRCLPPVSRTLTFERPEVAH